MELALRGTVKARGKGAAMVALTADMCSRFGVKIGDQVEYYYEGDKLILKFPKGERPEGEKVF